jgi:iron(III) transport system permease protein
VGILARAFSEAVNWTLLKNSLLVSGATAGLCVAIGFLVALGLAAAPRGTRSFWLLGVIATLALPPFLVLNSWLEWFGPSGRLRALLPLPLYSLGGTIAVLTGGLWPLSTLLALGAWDRLESAQLESDARLRGAALIRWLLWPAAQQSMGLALLLTFVLAFNQFTVPVILQVPVFPEELWLALSTRLNQAGAWTAAAPMILVPLLVLWLARGAGVAWPREAGAVDPAVLARQLGCRWRRAGTMALVVLLLVGLVLPLAQLLAQGRTWAELPGLLKTSRAVTTNSLLMALVTASACLAAGLLLRSWRWGWVSWALFFVPGILLSQLLLSALGGTVLYGTSFLVFIALTFHYAPISWRGANDAQATLDGQLVDAGRLEGARGWTLLRHYLWPQLKRPLATTWYITYLLVLWDVETVVLIYPPGGDTLPLRIFQMLHYGHNSQVNAMCVVLLVLALAPLLVWKAIAMVADRRNGA